MCQFKNDKIILILRGKRTEVKIPNLAACSCYSLRIKIKSNTDWIYFKAATEDEGPYSSVMHISRAIKMGNTSLIRKIAHHRYDILMYFSFTLFNLYRASGIWML